MNNLDGIVSLFIACIELVLLVNLLVFTDKNRQNFLVYLILLLLTGYQTFEYLICGIGMKFASRTSIWSFTVRIRRSYMFGPRKAW